MYVASNPKVVLRQSAYFLIVSFLVGVMAPMTPGDALAQTAVDLGDAAPFGVLAGLEVTNTGPTVVNGDVGVDPGTSVSGFNPPGTVNGMIYDGTTAEAEAAKVALVTAYDDAAGQTPGTTITELGGEILAPGVYASGATMNIANNTDLTLNASGNPNAVWIFQAGSDLIVGTNTAVILINDAQATNVFWQVTSSATIGTGSEFNGTIMALTAITMNTGATLCGRALARNAEVTLNDNTITIPTQGGTTPCDLVLPVEMTSFTGEADRNVVTLRWATASEKNNAGFAVEHAFHDAFREVAFVAGRGTTLEASTYSYALTGLNPGQHRFRLKQVDYDGAHRYSSELELTISVPDKYHLEAAYPNPFNPQTAINFLVAEEQAVTVDLYNMLGLHVRTLHAGVVEANETQTVHVDGMGLPSGVYIVRLTGQNFTASQQIVLMK